MALNLSLTRRDFSRLLGASAATAALAPWPPAFGADNSDLALLSITEASARIHAKSLTPTQLTQALLDRINLYNPKVNCYITVMAQEALAQAAVLDTEAKAGRFRGPLHGIPIALKDNIDTAGTRTTAASPMFVNRIPTDDADIVTRLKKNGAIIVGKLNLHEFAIGCTGDISYFGPTRNPWALDYISGGSSAGSGASVAADMAFGALGTDTGGSIRVPSAWCGTVGLKATVGLVSIRGIVPLRESIDHCGPIGKNVEDVALMLGQMTGYDALDPHSIESQPQDYVKQMKQPVKTFRLGTPDVFFDHVDPEIDKAVKAALVVLTGLTAGVTSHAPLWDGLTGNGMGETEEYHHKLIEKYGVNYMSPDRARMARMENPPAGTKVPTAAEAVEDRHRLFETRRLIDSHFTNFDLVVAPTTRMKAGKINESLALEGRAAGAADAGGDGKIYNWFASGGGCMNTSPFDAYGIPALTLPCGFTSEGMPIGLMIAGPHFAEGKVLALAYAYQQATDWHTKHPRLTPDMPVPPIVEVTPRPAGGGAPAS